MKTMSLLTAALALVAASPVFAVETLTATFTTPDGGVTADSYSGSIRVTVSGVGQSVGRRYNDAFYGYYPLPISHNPVYNQLTFSTSTLTGHRQRLYDATNFIEGGLPAYEASHVYSFILDTGATTPTKLHFGVSDGMFSDNTGAYVITIAVPEPATWALMIAGFGSVGFALRRRGQGSVVVAA